MESSFSILGDLLKEKIAAAQNGSFEKFIEEERKTYNKNWAKAVQFFQTRINKQRARENSKPCNFISIRNKLEAIKEIDDLRWFYGECIKYESKRDDFGRRIPGNTFNKCFFGALKIK